MGAPRIFILCPDDNGPWGGILMLYRHVDILNKNGHWASVLHQEPGFRCTWFANQTRVSHVDEVALGPADLLALPEIYGPRLAEICRGLRKVVFNQNAYNTFRGYDFDPSHRATPYADPEVVAALVVSEDNRRYLEYVFPRLPVFRCHYAIDPELYPYVERKKPQLAFMPRKNEPEALQVINLLKFRGALDAYTVCPIANRTAEQTAVILRESLFFLCFGYPEGFGLPPAEAMACGCLTIGYPGQGGREFWDPELCYPIQETDVLQFARVTERVLADYSRDPGPLDERRRRAAAAIREAFTAEREEAGIVAAWTKIKALPWNGNHRGSQWHRLDGPCWSRIDKARLTVG